MTKTKTDKKLQNIQNFFKREIVKIVFNIPIQETKYSLKDLDCLFDYYTENRTKKSLEFSIENKGLSFDSLSELSILLGTTNINFTPRGEHWEYSEYTAGTDGFLNIYCYDVKFPEI